MKRIIATTALIALALSIATSSLGQAKLTFWFVLGGAYLVTAAMALHKMWDDGALRDMFRLRGGDITVGLLLAAVLGLATWMARTRLFGPGSSQHAWFFRIYFQLAAPALIRHHVLLTLAVVGIALLEEITWRGFVQRLFEERFGTRRGWILGALAYTLAHIPTMFCLSDPGAGLNPLLVLAALGGGLCWGFTMRLMGRLPPVLVSHVALAYFAVSQFAWPHY